jgi:hypothetical protein
MNEWKTPHAVKYTNLGWYIKQRSLIKKSLSILSCMFRLGQLEKRTPPPHVRRLAACSGKRQILPR